MFERLVTPDDNALYHELPARTGHGDFVKAWWIHNEEASPFIRLLDDDDWMPPNAVADMMRVVTDKVVLVICGMVLTVAQDSRHGSPGYYRVVTPKLAQHHAATGTILFRTSAARQVTFPLKMPTDYHLAAAVAAHGQVKTVHTPLYWYNAHKSGKTAAQPLGSPYLTHWVIKAPRTFRKRLFNQVPLGNYLDEDGEFFRTVYDQAMFRPMSLLARKIVWLRNKTYFYDQDGATNTEQVARDVRYIMDRGFVAGDDCPESVPSNTRPEIVFVVPVYRARDRIARCLESIEAQAGRWRCIVAVDGNDEETAHAARQAVARDGRFEVLLHQQRLYALKNIVVVVSGLPDDTIVAIVDGDDYLLTSDLVRTLEQTYADPDVDIVCGKPGTVELSRYARLRRKWGTLKRELKMLKEHPNPKRRELVLKSKSHVEKAMAEASERNAI